MIDRHPSEILHVMNRWLVPSARLFALYVLFHGHSSPGGGFQAGAVLAGAVFLRRLAEGALPPAVRAARERAAVRLAAAGIAVYGLTGLAAFLLGGAFLDYAFLPFPADAPMRRYWGILLVETGVCVAVAAVLAAVFDFLSPEADPAPGGPAAAGGADRG